MNKNIEEKNQVTNGSAPSTDLVERFAKEKNAQPRLIKLKVSVTCGGPATLGRFSIPPEFSQGAGSLFTWDLTRTALTTQAALLLCTEVRSGEVVHKPEDYSWSGTIEMLCSVHPKGSAIAEYSALKDQWEQAMYDLLQENYKGKHNVTWPYLSEVRIIDIEADPGIPKVSGIAPGVGKQVEGRIMIGLNTTRSVTTCFLSGKHFYPPIPLGFFYEGKLDQPVHPYLAMAVGFTARHEAWFNICDELGSPDTVQHLSKVIGWDPLHDEQYFMNLFNESWAGWPGRIDTYFGHYYPVSETKPTEVAQG